MLSLVASEIRENNFPKIIQAKMHRRALKQSKEKKMLQPDTSVLMKELEQFKREKEKIRKLVGQIGGAASTRRDRTINLNTIQKGIPKWLTDKPSGEWRSPICRGRKNRKDVRMSSGDPRAIPSFQGI
jgi:hypothetical protein